MTLERAAIVIQNAWRRFDDDRKDRFIDEYNKEMMDTYYHECYSEYHVHPERPTDYDGMYEAASYYNNM